MSTTTMMAGQVRASFEAVREQLSINHPEITELWIRRRLDLPDSFEIILASPSAADNLRATLEYVVAEIKRTSPNLLQHLARIRVFNSDDPDLKVIRIVKVTDTSLHTTQTWRMGNGRMTEVIGDDLESVDEDIRTALLRSTESHDEDLEYLKDR